MNRLRAPGAPPDVEIVHAYLDGPTHRLAHLLSPEEVAAADRLHREADRRRYVAAHSLLRQTLGARLGIDPAAVRLAPRTGRGAALSKPRLAVEHGDLRFNLSHGGRHVLVATGRREVGVDVEPLVAADAITSITPSLHPQEIATLHALPEAERPAAVTTVWARKESLLKAMGTGLSRPPHLDHIGAGPDPRQPVTGWHTVDLAVGADARAALTWAVPD